MGRGRHRDPPYLLGPPFSENERNELRKSLLEVVDTPEPHPADAWLFGFAMLQDRVLFDELIECRGHREVRAKLVERIEHSQGEEHD